MKKLLFLLFLLPFFTISQNYQIGNKRAKRFNPDLPHLILGSWEFQEHISFQDGLQLNNKRINELADPISLTDAVPYGFMINYINSLDLGSSLDNFDTTLFLKHGFNQLTNDFSFRSSPIGNGIIIDSQSGVTRLIGGIDDLKATELFLGIDFFAVDFGRNGIDYSLNNTGIPTNPTDLVDVDYLNERISNINISDIDNTTINNNISFSDFPVLWEVDFLKLTQSEKEVYTGFLFTIE